MGLWALCGSWASDQLTDGFIPDYIVQGLGGRAWKRATDRLVAAGLWIPGTDGTDHGWWFHQFLERNPSRADVEADRCRTRERVAKWRAAHAANKE